MEAILAGQWLDAFPKCIVLLADMHCSRTSWEELARSLGCHREVVEGKGSVCPVCRKVNQTSLIEERRTPSAGQHPAAKAESVCFMHSLCRLHVCSTWFDKTFVAMFRHSGAGYLYVLNADVERFSDSN